VAGARDTASDEVPLDLISREGMRYRLMVRPVQEIRFGRTYPLVIGALVSLFFSAGVAWYLARPLTLLSRGFQAVGAGQLATRVHPLVGSRRDEIADLTREFDGMAAQLQQLLAVQERLLHDISHELRSPLTRLQVVIGLLRQSSEKLPEMLARVEREAERLDQLIGELLTLARLKSGAPEIPAGPVDVIDLLTAIVDDANFEAQAKRCEVHLAAPDSFVTVAHGELLYRAFENIIRNAVKFSPRQARIDVIAEVLGKSLHVRVVDHGPGAWNTAMAPE
jgi:signal transduction histidine kinase